MKNAGQLPLNRFVPNVPLSQLHVFSPAEDLRSQRSRHHEIFAQAMKRSLGGTMSRSKGDENDAGILRRLAYAEILQGNERKQKC